MAGLINCALLVGQLGCGLNDHYILPPKEYDRPFPGTIIENTVIDQEQMAIVCAPNPKAAVAMGCSRHYRHPSEERDRCYIYIAPDNYLNKYHVTVDAVRRHEIAHCLGWPQSHPR